MLCLIRAYTYMRSTSLLAIMFGRLGMSVDESKTHCSAIVNEVFSEKKRFSTGHRFKASKLEAIIKRILNTCGAGEDARMMDPGAGDAEGCKV
jgi:hypothetical protein